jgi:transcriptional regulator with XRE-family HTH domain
MRTFEFTIVASGLDHRAEGFEDLFYKAGCDDATIAVARGVILVQFAREAEHLSTAVETAITDVRKTGASIERVEPDYLVSLSDIAERSNLTRAAVSLYAKGERGKNFPHPVVRMTTESPLWDWSQVAEWLCERKQLDEDIVAAARIFREVNTPKAGELRTAAR